MYIFQAPSFSIQNICAINLMAVQSIVKPTMEIVNQSFLDVPRS